MSLTQTTAYIQLILVETNWLIFTLVILFCFKAFEFFVLVSFRLTSSISVMSCAISSFKSTSSRWMGSEILCRSFICCSDSTSTQISFAISDAMFRRFKLFRIHFFFTFSWPKLKILSYSPANNSRVCFLGCWNLWQTAQSVWHDISTHWCHLYDIFCLSKCLHTLQTPYQF